MGPAAAAAAAAATADALAWPLEVLLEEARAWSAWRAHARGEDGACLQTPAARREHKAAVRKARAAAAKAAAAEAEAVDSCEIRLRPLAAWARLCGAAADAAAQRPGDMRKCRAAKVAQRLGALLQPWLSDGGILDPGMHHRPPVEGAGAPPAPSTGRRWCIPGSRMPRSGSQGCSTQPLRHLGRPALAHVAGPLRGRVRGRAAQARPGCQRAQPDLAGVNGHVHGLRLGRGGLGRGGARLAHGGLVLAPRGRGLQTCAVLLPCVRAPGRPRARLLQQHL